MSEEEKKAEPIKKETREKKAEGEQKKEGHKKEAKSHWLLTSAPKKLWSGITGIAGWVRKKAFQTAGLGVQGAGAVIGPPIDVARGLGKTAKETAVNEWKRGKNFLKLTGKLTGISWIVDEIRKSIHEATGDISGGKPKPAH